MIVLVLLLCYNLYMGIYLLISPAYPLILFTKFKKKKKNFLNVYILGMVEMDKS